MSFGGVKMIRFLRFGFLVLLIGLTLGVGVLNAAPTPAAEANGGWLEAGPGSASRGAGISQTFGLSENPVLAIGSDGTTVIAWEEKNNENWEIYVKRWNGSAWVEMGPGSASGGGISDTTTRSTEPSLAVASDGRPVVAWVESQNEHSPGEIYVKVWDGSAWVANGADSASGGGISNSEESYSYNPSLAIGPDKMPIIAWSEALAGTGWIYVKRWNGSAWIETGVGSASGVGISGGAELSSDPSLAIGPDGIPVVSWQVLSNNNWEIYARRWNGSSWVEMGMGSASGGGISNNKTGSYSPSLAIGLDGAPVVAWSDHTEEAARIFVRRWNGSAWVEVGAGSATTVGIGNNDDSAHSPSLAIGPDNSPIVAWESRIHMRVFVKRFNGATWAEVSAGSASGDGISGNQGSARLPSLAVSINGKPVVAWRDSADGVSEIYLRRWNDSAWVEMGQNSSSSHGGISSTGKAAYPSLAFGPDGNPVVAWEDNSSGDWEIYVKRWNGSAWVQMGAGSASGGGVSNNRGNSRNPSLAIGPDGATVVAWQDEYDYWKSGIYVRRWNGSAWVEMGAGSASGVGISNGSSEFYSPSLVIGPDGVPVIAWSGPSDTFFNPWNIFIKRWNGSAWVEMGAGSASGGGVSNTLEGSSAPSLAIGPDKMPVVAWAQVMEPVSNRREIYVKRWNGSAWTELGTGSASGGGISNTPNISSSPTVAVGSDGKPVVAWTELFYRNGNEMVVAIHVRRWNGSSWAEVGAGSAAGDGISYNPESTSSTDPSLVIGPGGEPIVAWGVRNTLWETDENVFVKRWNGSAWVEMDEGSATGRGITDDPGYASYPSMATGPNKLPIVAWMDNYNGANDIFVRRYPAACHALTLTHTGQGGNPAAVPANSVFCPTGHYSAGELIHLVASPASGWIVSGWSGTNNNSSIANGNTVTMPDATHAVSVSYREFHPTDWSFTPLVIR